MLPPLENGTILRERYKLTNVVGRGGMGSVYRAEDLRLPGRLCAIKEVQPDPNAPPAIREQEQAQFLQEASILAQLDHPNLPKVSDFFADDGRDYLVMDYVPGKDLKEILEENLAEGLLLGEKLVLNWAFQILDALIYLHRQDPPVLHRDIKPANIKLTPDNRIKLVDFGLAKILAPNDLRTITVIQGRGTALYTPLEQYGGESDHTDVRSDIYSLGATLYTLLVGQPPPSAKERFLNPGYLRPPKFYNHAISKQVSDTILWSMEMHPSQRPQSTEILRAALTGKTVPYTSIPYLKTPTLGEAIVANLIPFALVLLLLLSAVFLTIS